MIATVVRQQFLEDRTLGELFVNGKHFCYTLEDPVRGAGIKIKDKTAIPAGVYRLDVNKSPSFGRNMVQILDVPNFEGIRCHGGNTPDNTSGCILIAYQNAAGNKIYQTAEAEFTSVVRNLLDTGDDCFIVIVDDVRGTTG